MTEYDAKKSLPARFRRGLLTACRAWFQRLFGLARDPSVGGFDSRGVFEGNFSQSPTIRPAAGLAWGGRVPGVVSRDRADDVWVRATAGEWVIQRSAVRRYGPRVMEAINQARIPKAALELILPKPLHAGALPPQPTSTAARSGGASFADGGPVGEDPPVGFYGVDPGASARPAAAQVDVLKALKEALTAERDRGGWS
jgi:hypothetical protein